VDVQLWTIEKLRELPPASRPSGDSVLFTGGLLDGEVKHMPTTVDDVEFSFDGSDHGQPVRQKYRLTGWRPDPGLWVYALDQEP
jgi:hypothetical protein